MARRELPTSKVENLINVELSPLQIRVARNIMAEAVLLTMHQYKSAAIELLLQHPEGASISQIALDVIDNPDIRGTERAASVENVSANLRSCLNSHAIVDDSYRMVNAADAPRAGIAVIYTLTDLGKELGESITQIASEGIYHSKLQTFPIPSMGIRIGTVLGIFDCLAALYQHTDSVPGNFTRKAIDTYQLATGNPLTISGKGVMFVEAYIKPLADVAAKVAKARTPAW